MPSVPAIALSIIFVLLSALGHYRFCGSDLANYMPFLLHAHDSTLFANDLLIGTISSHPVLIWKALAPFLGFMGIQTLVLCWFCIQTAVITLGAVFLYRALFGNCEGAPMLLLMLLLPSSVPGFGLYGLNPYGYFQPCALSIGTACFAFGCMARKKWVLAGALSGLIFLLHPISGVFAGFVFAAAAITALAQEPQTRASRIHIIAGFLLLVIVASPSWLQEAAGMLNHQAPAAATVDKALWRSVAEWRLNHGGFVSRWNLDRFIQVLLVFGGVLVFLRHPAFPRVAPILAGTLLSLAIAVLGDFADVRLFIRLQQGRMTLYVYLVLIMFLANFWAGLVSAETGQKPVRRLPLFAAAIGVFLLCFTTGFAGQPAWLKTIVLACMAAAAAVPLFPAIEKRTSGMVLFAALTLATTGVVVIRTVDSVKNAACTECMDANWRKVQEWCLHTTPTAEVILTPFYKEGFRCYSQRAIFADYKDGGPHLFSDATFGEWWSRMQSLGVAKVPMDKSLMPALYHRNAVDVAAKNGLRFVVLENGLRTDTNAVVYKNECFCVVKIDNKQ